MEPLPLFGPHVLPAVGGHGGAHGFQRAGKEHGHLVGGGGRGDIHGAQHIHGALQHHAADGGDGKLQSHGQPQGQKVPDAPPGPGPVAFFQPEHLKAPAHLPQAAEARQKLADGGGEGRAEHPPLQADDEKQVQGDVHRRGHHQPDHGGAAVPHRPEDARAHIVKDIPRDARENGGDVDPGAVDDIRGGIHQLQDIPAEDHRHSGDQHPEKDAAAGRPCHIFPQGVIVPRAETLGDGNGEAAADADGPAHHQKVDGAGAAHRRQGVSAQKLAHNGGIHHAVELLEQHTQQNGQAELQNQGQGTALCKVFGHGTPPRMDSGRPGRPAVSKD